MAIEAKRGCGYRVVGGLYLVGGFRHAPCDRVPLPVGACPTCGRGIHFTRAFTEVDPLRLFGPHDRCADGLRPCHVCDPRGEPAYIMTVGSRYYTPESFVQEALAMGISRRIPFVPKGLELGKTVVYLAHPKAVEVKEPLAVQAAMSIVEADSLQPRLLEAERKPVHRMGIFCAFVPQGVEKLIRESEAGPDELEKLRRRGITPIVVPDGDPDHEPGREQPLPGDL